MKITAVKTAVVNAKLRNWICDNLRRQHGAA
jgi:hypothetical protein